MYLTPASALLDMSMRFIAKFLAPPLIVGSSWPNFGHLAVAAVCVHLPLLTCELHGLPASTSYTWRCLKTLPLKPLSLSTQPLSTELAPTHSGPA